MTMTFTDDPASANNPSSSHRPVETSLQRRLRLRREAEARSRPKSKAELAAEEASRREAALSQSLLTSQPKSKGLAMMARMGFKPGAALGKASDAVREPVRIEVKDGREGIGLESERKRKIREAAEEAGERAKKARAEEGDYRERLRREREEGRWERQVGAAMKVAERMAGEREEERQVREEEEGDGNGDRKEGKEAGEKKTKDGTTLSSRRRPLKSIPVVWRGLVKSREEAERDRRMRYDLEQGLSRLPTYDDAEEDADDKKALGKARTTYVTAEDLDEEDPELDEFNALPAEERLRRVVGYLRNTYHYCFWCKFTYPDEEMEGCPGVTEEDHD